MNRDSKTQLVLDIRESLDKASLIVVTQQVGMTVDQSTKLRREMKDQGAEFKVLKNTLARIAVKDTRFESVSSLLSGPTALAYSEDPIAAAKVIAKFASSNEQLKIVGGFLNGQVLSEASVKALATLPSLDELRAKIIGVISAPATKLATLLQEPACRMARVLAAKAN